MESLGTILGGSGTCKPQTWDERRKERMEAANTTPGTLEGYNCPECGNRGFNLRVDERGCATAVECRCMIRRRSEAQIARSGLAELVKRYTFDAWQDTDLWQRRARELAQGYAEDPIGWFVAAGSVGTGKSHLCTAICKQLMERGLAVRYMLWRDVSVQAKAVVNDDEAYSKIVDPLKRIKVLYIDDLFKTGKGQEPTVGDVNLAFEILNARYNDSEKITIISTERSIEELLDIDEAVGSRIYERSKGKYLDLRGRENWRLR